MNLLLLRLVAQKIALLFSTINCSLDSVPTVDLIL